MLQKNPRNLFAFPEHPYIILLIQPNLINTRVKSLPSLPPLSFDTYYHIYNRGINRENVFREERNYSYFLRLYIKYIEPIAETFAYCLLRNHFHLLVRIKSQDEIRAGRTLWATPMIERLDHTRESSRTPLLIVEIPESYASQQFSNFFNAYAKAFNKSYNRTGSLFQHPFGRVPVTDPSQYERLLVYIHQNPQKHGFVRDFRDWKYSSYNALLSKKQTHIMRSQVLTWFGGSDEFSSFHQILVGEPDRAWFMNDDQLD